jgi:hypothetical protein
VDESSELLKFRRIEVAGILVGNYILPVDSRSTMKTAFFTVFLWACTSSIWGVTFNITAGYFHTAGGLEVMPTSGLVLLAVSTDNNSWAAPTPTSFFNDDDMEVARWDLSTNVYGAGTLGPAPASFSYTTAIDANDPMRLYWYPSLSISSTAPGSGTAYGAFRTDSIIDFSDSGWVLPVNEAATLGLNFLTVSLGGSNPESAGWADYLVPIPEPSTYASVFGALSLVGAVAFRRFRAGRSETP